MKVLFAESKDRTEIFRRIFDTDIYSKMTLELGNKLKETKEILSEQKTEFVTIVSNIVLQKPVENYESKDVNELYMNQVLETLELEVNDNEDTYFSMQKEVRKLEKETNKISDRFQIKSEVRNEIYQIEKEIKVLDLKISDGIEEQKRSNKFSENLKIIKESFQEYQDVQKNSIQIKTKIASIKEIIKLQNEQEKETLEYTNNELDYKKMTTNYLEQEDTFFREQAGILAEKLEKNKPCPVCGSLLHPKIAKKGKNVLNKEELDDLKKMLEKKHKDLQGIKERITGLKSKIDTLKETLAIEEDASKLLKLLEIKLQETESTMNSLYEKMNSAYEKISGKNICLESFNFEEYSEEVSNQILEMREKLAKNRVLKEEKKKQLSNKKKELKNIDLLKLEEELKLKKKVLEEKRDYQIKQMVILDRNKKAYEELKKKSKKLKETIHCFNLFDELYRTASGTLKGKTKIDFEQYVQAVYFDMIIFEANKRLLKMTEGRFQLIRKESSNKISDKIGLDLEVIDYYNGKKRDVKSLSGGEAFKASLALALGLSDIIQNYSGGVQVDTLFIDEGFGSLDSESREQAISTLNQLSGNNKLIGIISHVTELKERIDKKIIVSTSQTGSKILVEG